MTTESMMPQEAAALLLSIIENEGGIVTLNERAHFHIDLDPCRHKLTDAKAKAVIEAIFALSDEIRAILRSRRVVH